MKQDELQSKDLVQNKLISEPYKLMSLGNHKILNEEEYIEYLFLRSYVQGWKVRKLLNRRNRIRNEVKDPKMSSMKKMAKEATLEELKLKIKREGKEYWRRKLQLLAYRPEHTNK